MKSKKNQIIIFSLVLFMAILSITNLNNRYLWYDEAHTALIGRNVLQYGVPKVWDGKYLVTTSNGNDFDDNLIIIKDGWVQYYFAAIGEVVSPILHPRIIFVLVGIVGALLIYFLSKNLTDNEQISIMSLTMYCTSIPIILYIRQVRYYAPAIMFCLLVMLMYILAIKRNKFLGWFFFAVSAVMLYHTLHLFFIIIMLSISLRYLLFDKRKWNIKPLLFSIIGIFICTFPFFIYNQNYLYTLGDKRSSFQGISYMFIQIPGYISQINAYFFPFISLFVIYGIVKLIDRILYYSKHDISDDGIMKKIRTFSVDPNLFQMVCIIIINVLLNSTFSVQYATRYLLPSVLMSYILCSIALYKFLLKDKCVGIILLIIVIFTNFLNVAPYTIFRLLDTKQIKTVEKVIKPPIPYFIAQGNFTKVDTLESYIEEKLEYTSYLNKYLLEISNDYNDATEGVVEFLKENAKEGETVQADDFLSDSIAYYTNLQVVNRLKVVSNKDDFWYSIYKHLPNAEKYLNLTRYPEELVKWKVILPSSKQESESIKKNVDQTVYKIIEIEGYPNSLFAADIWEHSFTTDYCYANAIILKNKRVQ